MNDIENDIYGIGKLDKKNRQKLGEMLGMNIKNLNVNNIPVSYYNKHIQSISPDEYIYNFTKNITEYNLTNNYFIHDKYFDHDYLLPLIEILNSKITPHHGPDTDMFGDAKSFISEIYTNYNNNHLKTIMIIANILLKATINKNKYIRSPIIATALIVSVPPIKILEIFDINKKDYKLISNYENYMTHERVEYLTEIILGKIEATRNPRKIDILIKNYCLKVINKENINVDSNEIQNQIIDYFERGLYRELVQKSRPYYPRPPQSLNESIYSLPNKGKRGKDPTRQPEPTRRHHKPSSTKKSNLQTRLEHAKKNLTKRRQVISSSESSKRDGSEERKTIVYKYVTESGYNKYGYFTGCETYLGCKFQNDKQISPDYLIELYKTYKKNIINKSSSTFKINNELKKTMNMAVMKFIVDKRKALYNFLKGTRELDFANAKESNGGKINTIYEIIGECHKFMTRKKLNFDEDDKKMKIWGLFGVLGRFSGDGNKKKIPDYKFKKPSSRVKNKFNDNLKNARNLIIKSKKNNKFLESSKHTFHKAFNESNKKTHKKTYKKTYKKINKQTNKSTNKNNQALKKSIMINMGIGNMGNGSSSSEYYTNV